MLISVIVLFHIALSHLIGFIKQSHLCLKTKSNFVTNYTEKCFKRVGTGSGADSADWG